MNLSRRTLLGCGCLSLFGGASSTSLADTDSRPLRGTTGQAHDRIRDQVAMTPETALALLIEGNRRFVADAPSQRDTGRARRLELSQGQRPFAVVLSCSDSRVPPELLFSRGLGEIFTVRNAGNTVDAAALGSMEYAVAALGVPLIVVLGHEGCGAVDAAIAIVESNKVYAGSIGTMIEPIIPSVLQARSALLKKPSAQPEADRGDLLDNSIREHVRRTVARLNDEPEPLLGVPLRERRLRIVGARYDLQDGEVEFFS